MGKGLAIAGFVLTLIGLVLGFVPLIALAGFPVALTGLILSVVGGKKLKAAGLPHGLATAGLVLGIIAVVITGITFLTCGLCTLCAAGTAGALEGLL